VPHLPEEQAELLLAALDAVEGDLDAGVVVFRRGRAGVPGCSGHGPMALSKPPWSGMVMAWLAHA
jgi:hypothetical protein